MTLARLTPLSLQYEEDKPYILPAPSTFLRDKCLFMKQRRAFKTKVHSTMLTLHNTRLDLLPLLSSCQTMKGESLHFWTWPYRKILHHGIQPTTQFTTMRILVTNWERSHTWACRTHFLILISCDSYEEHSFHFGQKSQCYEESTL